ncbi:MAG: WD40 repeat domain-containing protein [Thalassotalea sp.]|nr:WD40 repeat domain-containing protein [Thalassotalea sp.]
MKITRRSLLLVVIISYLIIGCEKPVTLISSNHHQFTENAVIDADISDDGKYSLILEVNNSVSLWDNTTYSLINEWEGSEFTQQQYKVVLSKDNQWIAVSGKHFVTLFSVNGTHKKLSWKVNGFSKDAQISQVMLNSIGNKVIIGLTEGSVIVADITSETRSQFNLHEGPVTQLKFSDNEQRLISASLDGQVNKWDISTGKVIWNDKLPFRITSLAFDDLSQKLFISDALNNQRFLSLDRGVDISKLNYFERNRYFREAIFLDGTNKLLTSSSKYQISLWNVETGDEHSQGEIRAHNFGSTVLDFAVNENNDILTLSSDGVLELWSKTLFR